MNNLTKSALAAAAGVVLLGGAGIVAFGAAESVRGVFSLSQPEWPVVIVALGLLGYTAAILVAAFGKHRPRHLRS